LLPRRGHVARGLAVVLAGVFVPLRSRQRCPDSVEPQQDIDGIRFSGKTVGSAERFLTPRNPRSANIVKTMEIAV
jgi:hypothetical protein